MNFEVNLSNQAIFLTWPKGRDKNLNILRKSFKSIAVNVCYNAQKKASAGEYAARTIFLKYMFDTEYL